ncbi:MAG: alpha/beta fold hydrolase [Allorhizobium sp.]
MTLNAVTAGDFDVAAPLVLLHGFGGGAFVWREVMAGLPEGYPVIAYDLPGHGLSLHAEGIGGAGRMAKAVIADIESRGIRQFHVAGHSLGGAASAILALKSPERVRSATLLAPGGFGPAINHRALARYAFAETFAELRRALEVMMGFNANIPDAMVADMLAARGDPAAREALARIFEAMFVVSSSGERLQGTLPMEGLAALSMPQVVVWGEEDCILPPSQSEGLPANIAVHRIPKSGHMLVDECPERVIELLRNAIMRSR